MSDNPFEPDRRATNRRLLRVRAEVVLPGNQVHEVRTTDISMDGVGIVASANPQRGATFDLRFSMPRKPTGTTAVSVRVQVMHCVFSRDEAGFKIGLKFLSQDTQRDEAIRQLLN